jgi:cell division protein FtsL
MSQLIHRLEIIRQALSFSSARTWSLLVATIVLFGAVYMGQSSQAAMTGQRVLEKQDKLTRLEQENVQMQADIAVMLSPDRIEKRARAIGLHLANPDQIKYIGIRDFPVDSKPALATTAPAPTPASGLDVTAWWSDLQARLGVGPGPRAVEATTRP